MSARRATPYMMTMKTLAQSIVAAAALTAAMVFDAPVGHAHGDAPWCAVVEIGGGDVEWDCQYRTVEECVPNVIGGARGFCNVNPYGPGLNTAAVAHPRQHSHVAKH